MEALRRLSDKDLQAIAGGDYSKVSDEGLALLAGGQESGPDPTEGMSKAELAAAGLGKAVYDTGRGVGQRIGDLLPGGISAALGLPTAADVDAARRRDAALMNTGSRICKYISNTNNISSC